MKTTIERSETKAVFNGNIHVKIPIDVSAISMLGNGQDIYDCDDFVSEPHWIVNHKLGKKRKALRRIGGSHGPIVWTRLLEPEALGEIEQRYHNIVSRTRSFFDTEWKFAMEELKRVKVAHVIPRRHLKMEGNSGYNEKVWEYRAFNYDYGWSYGFDWIEAPNKMRNVKVGELIYEAERRSEIIENRRSKFREVMNHTFRSYIYANCKMYDSKSIYHQQICLIKVNGREYAFECNYKRGIVKIDFERLPEVGS